MPQLDGSSPSSWVICCLRKGINRKLEGKWYSEDSNELSTFCFCILARTSQKRYAHLWTSYQQAYSVTISWLLILYLITCLVQHLHSKLAGFPFRVDWHPVGKYFLTQCLISHHTIIQQFSIHLWLLHGNFLFFLLFSFSMCQRSPLQGRLVFSHLFNSSLIFTLLFVHIWEVLFYNVSHKSWIFCDQLGFALRPGTCKGAKMTLLWRTL